MKNLERSRFLENEKIFLTLPIEEDFDKYFYSFTNKEFCFLTGSPYFPNDYEEAKENFIKNLTKANTKRIFLAIISKNNGEYLGNVGLDSIDTSQGTAAIGCFLFKNENRNKGIGSDAVKLLLKYGFLHLNLRRIKSSTHSNNIASQKSQEKIGFVKEGIFRKEIYFEGKYYDSIKYAMLREDFDKLDWSER